MTCRSCTEVGRHEKACTGRREEQTKGRPQTLREIQKGTDSCNADATTRRKTRSDTRTATRDKAQLQMCRKTKAGLIEEFPETLSDELNLQPMRSGEPMHIHLQDGARPRKTTVPRQVAKRFENAANTTLNDLIARGVLVKEPGVSSLGPKGRQHTGETLHRLQRTKQNG